MFGKKWLALAAGVVFSFAAGGAHAAEVIKIGVHGAHSGDLAGYGVPGLNAARLVFDAVNAKGGINGKMIELISQDDQCKPELSTNAATKLIADGVTIVMGPTCSGATKAALPMYTDKKVVVVSPSATSPELTQSGKFPSFFRTTPSDDSQAQLAVDFVLKHLQAKKIAILHDKGDYGKGYATFVKQFIADAKSDAEIVFFDGMTPGGVDYSPIIQKIARSGADTIIFGGYYPEASKLMTVIKGRKLNLNFVSEDGVKTESFVALAGEASEGVYASCSRDFANVEQTNTALNSHRERYKAEPGQFFLQSYAAAQAIVSAIEKAGSTEAEAVMKALRTETVETPIGNIHFDERGDTVGAEFVMFQVKGGKFVEVPTTW